VLRTFRSWGRLVAETPQGEAVIALGDDRVVLRRADRQFWPAVTCSRCAAATARVDLPDHLRRCRAGRPARAGVDGAAATSAVRRARKPVGKRSSPRPFGRARPVPAEFLVLAALVLYVVAVVTMLP
jgi:hypothetical protein